MSNFKQLIESLTANSNTKEADFTKLREEWELTDVLKQDSWNECLCGKDIKELCYIKNKFNGKVLIVGNECIKKICPSGNFSTKTKQLFNSIRNLSKKRTLNRLLIEYCKEKNIINDWEYKFSLDTHFKRQLSDKQKARKEIIDTKILKTVKKEKPIELTSVDTQYKKTTFEKPKIKLK